MNVFDLFKGDRCIKFKNRLEGQIIENDIVYIGNRAGPEIHISNLFHEMAHFVEIDDVRCKAYGWGLKVPEIYVIDRMCVEPKTIQITEREIRVAAFQANLHKYFGYDDNTHKITSSYQYLPDFFLIPIEDGSSAYGDNRTHKLSYDEITKSQLKWIANQTEQQRKIYTIDFFMHEWERKSLN